jgi:hypothetical protein
MRQVGGQLTAYVGIDNQFFKLLEEKIIEGAENYVI